MRNVSFGFFKQNTMLEDTNTQDNKFLRRYLQVLHS